MIFECIMKKKVFGRVSFIKEVYPEGHKFMMDNDQSTLQALLLIVWVLGTSEFNATSKGHSIWQTCDSSQHRLG